MRAAAPAVRTAYDLVVRPFHSWLLRKTFDLVTTQIPSLDEAVLLMGQGLGEAERVGKVYEEIRMYLVEGWKVANTLDAIYDDLKLEDLRQV